MPDHDPMALSLELTAQCLGHVDRAMLSPGATDGDGEIASPIGLEAGDPVIEEALQVIAHARELRTGIEKIDHGLVTAGQRPERWLPMRIGQAAQVEDEVDIMWDAMFEAKRLQKDQCLG